MRVSLEEVQLFSQCPARYWFWQKDEYKQQRTKESIIRDIMQRAYKQAMNTEFRANWKKILEWVGIHAWAGVDKDNDGQCNIASSLSVQLLEAIREWYHDLYLKEDYIGYPDIEMELGIGSHIVTVTAPLVLTTTPPTIFTFTSSSMSSTKMYNDLYIRGLAHIATKTLETESVTMRCFEVGERTKLAWRELSASASSTVQSILRQILSAMEAKMVYPSRSEQCTSCPYSGRCYL